MTSIFSKRLGFAPEEGIKAPINIALTSQTTLSGTGTNIITGFTIVAGDRILVMGQTDGAENGIYVASVGTWSRSGDWNDSNDVANGQLVLDVNSSTIYQTSFSGDFEIGITSISFVSFQSGLLNVKIVNDTSYLVVQDDLGKLIIINGASDVLVDVVAGLGVGFNCEIVQLGDGQITLKASGSTLNSADGQLGSRSKYSPMALQCYLEDNFIVGGDLAIGSSAETQRSATLIPLQTLTLGVNSTAVNMATDNWYSFSVPLNLNSVLMVLGQNVTVEIWGVLDGVITNTGLRAGQIDSPAGLLAFPPITDPYSELFALVQNTDPAQSVQIRVD